ncbi:MAG: TSUP family transporter, partial [Cyanobacteria bacterium J06633_8]
MEIWLPLLISGLIAGILAGLLGIGGGTVLVPILLAFNKTPLQAVATSSLAIVITATSGTIQNWRMGYINFQK